MSEYGLMGVDWEERINFDRMRRDRVKKAQEALEKSGVNALFVFRLEDVRYLTSLRSHLGPVALLGLAAAVLPKGGDPILCTLDWFHSETRMPWLKKENILPRPFIRTAGGTKKWADEIKAKIGNLVEGKIGVDLYTPNLAKWLAEAFPKAEFVDGKSILAQAQMIMTPDEL
jgi:Xaa-Pro aminopeptidase